MAIKATASWRNAKGSSAERGYNYTWQKARSIYLGLHPLCVMCQASGRLTAASVVDHIKPHQGDQALFWDEANWQALCKRCHDSDKQMLERTGAKRASFDADGRIVW
jgi:5-methylcytosine-specific restriction protein A